MNNPQHVTVIMPYPRNAIIIDVDSLTNKIKDLDKANKGITFAFFGVDYLKGYQKALLDLISFLRN